MLRFLSTISRQRTLKLCLKKIAGVARENSGEIAIMNALTFPEPMRTNIKGGVNNA